jgi:hypothetical protein
MLYCSDPRLYAVLALTFRAHITRAVLTLVLAPAVLGVHCLTAH